MLAYLLKPRDSAQELQLVFRLQGVGEAIRVDDR